MVHLFIIQDRCTFFNSSLTFSGYTRLENGAVLSNETVGTQEGGAISFQSTVIFTGVSILSNNQARGGAMLATESKIMM